MVSKARAVRLSDEVDAWLQAYASDRGVSPSDVLRTAVESFREDCLRGVPEIRAAAAAQSSVRTQEGVGVCPRHADGHIWASAKIDPLRSCIHCGRHGREPESKGEPNGGFFAEATRGRAAFFGGLAAPMQSGTGKVAKP